MTSTDEINILLIQKFQWKILTVSHIIKTSNTHVDNLEDANPRNSLNIWGFVLLNTHFLLSGYAKHTPAIQFSVLFKKFWKEEFSTSKNSLPMPATPQQKNVTMKPTIT